MHTKFKRRGFTLVELLIVIVVIGVLAAMMMLSSDEAVSSARATKIIADMRTMKTALTAWYTDNYDRVVKQSNGEYKIYLNRDLTGTPQYLGNFLKQGNWAGKREICRYVDGSDSIQLMPHNDITNWTNSHAQGCYFLCSETVGEMSNKDNDDGSYGRQKSDTVRLRGTSWYVGYCFGKSEGKIKEKVAARAKSLGLVGGQQKVVNEIFKAEKGNFVYMMIMPLE